MTLLTRDRGRAGGVGLGTARGRVLLGLMLSVGLVAVDNTVIATAGPSVVADLGGLSHFPWIFSIYLLTQAVTMPLYGRLADQLGRKPVILFGIAVFLLGSLACAVAWNMPSLIAFRAIQGIGAGCIPPLSMIIAGDLYTVAERAVVQGYIASVWGVASLLGPALGALLAQYASWRWIFLINVPLGVVAGLALLRNFHEQRIGRDRRSDYPGAAMLTVGAGLLIFTLLEGTGRWGLWSAPCLLLVGAALVCLLAFVVVERSAADPILPLVVLGRRTPFGANLSAVCVGAVVAGLSGYVPLFVQGVLGGGVLEAGFALATLTLGWPISVALSGRCYLRFGFQHTALFGSVIVLAGLAGLALVGPAAPVLAVAAACLVVGLGLGFVSSPTLVAVQASVVAEHRGVVTGANTFCRAMGSAVGVAVSGAVANGVLNAGSRGGSAAKISLAPGELYSASHHVFLALLLAGVCGLAAVFIIPHNSNA
jgi:multidrug resistance protein